MNSCLKYFFVLFNLVFVIVGALCIGFVIWMRNIELFQSTLHVIGVDVALFYFGILLGGLLFLIGLCGSFGACYEKKSILVAYMSIILFFVGCELAAFVYAIVRGPTEFVSNLETVWKTVSNETKFIVQGTFNCCGYLNASEWEGDLHQSCINTNINSTSQVPWSTSCSDSILNYFQTNILVFGGALGATLFIQVFQAIITSLLLRSINVNNRVETGNRTDDPPHNMNLSDRSVTTHVPSHGARNVSYNNGSYEDESFFDDSRGRNMNKKRPKKSSDSPNW